MTDRPNFVMIPDSVPPPANGSILSRLRALATKAASVPATLGSALTHAEPPVTSPARPRLVFAVDATASREPAWAAARKLTDTLFKTLPGQLDVALAVHGGGRVHIFTEFTGNPDALRDRAAGVVCRAGLTRLLPILSATLRHDSVTTVVYIGDVFEENLSRAREIADAMGVRRTRLIVLHDTSADASARRDGEIFWDLAKRTGGCVLPFDAGASGRLRDLLSAVAVYAVGGEKLLRQRRNDLPGATLLLEHLNRG